MEIRNNPFVISVMIFISASVIWLILLQLFAKHIHPSTEKNGKGVSSVAQLEGRLDLLETKLKFVTSQLEFYEKRHTLVMEHIEKTATKVAEQVDKLQNKDSLHQLEMKVLTLEHKHNGISTKVDNFKNPWPALLDNFSNSWKAQVENRTVEMQRNMCDKFTADLSEAISNFQNISHHYEDRIVSLERKESSSRAQLTDFESRLTDVMDKFSVWKALVNNQIQDIHFNVNKLGSHLNELGTNFSTHSQKSIECASDLNSKLVASSDRVESQNNRVAGEIEALNSWKVTVATDIRLTDKELTTLWNDLGIPDQYGYVITQVENFNRDWYADSVARRRLQKRVNGHWVDI